MRNLKLKILSAYTFNHKCIYVDVLVMAKGMISNYNTCICYRFCIRYIKII